MPSLVAKKELNLPELRDLLTRQQHHLNDLNKSLVLLAKQIKNILAITTTPNDKPPSLEQIELKHLAITVLETEVNQLYDQFVELQNGVQKTQEEIKQYHHNQPQRAGSFFSFFSWKKEAPNTTPNPGLAL